MSRIACLSSLSFSTESLDGSKPLSFCIGYEPHGTVHVYMGRCQCGDSEHRVRRAHEMQAA